MHARYFPDIPCRVTRRTQSHLSGTAAQFAGGNPRPVALGTWEHAEDGMSMVEFLISISGSLEWKSGPASTE